MSLNVFQMLKGLRMCFHRCPFLPEASFGLWVLSLPASVCLCVRPSVCVCAKHLLVRAITHHPFKLRSPNLEYMCKRPWLRSLLFLGGFWPWPSRSNLTSTSKFTPFWACPRDNSSHVQAISRTQRQPPAILSSTPQLARVPLWPQWALSWLAAGRLILFWPLLVVETPFEF